MKNFANIIISIAVLLSTATPTLAQTTVQENENINPNPSVEATKLTRKEKKSIKKQQKQQEKQIEKEKKAANKSKNKLQKTQNQEIQTGVKKHFLNPNLDVYEVRASHILVKNRKDAVAIRKDILRGDITFEEAAKRYSLCPSGQYGGDLGFFNRKKMEQQFADTAFDLKIGEISDPVGTKFGWHIIKTTAKR